ncbi:MAG: hypothetical protein HON27_13895 [Candidatus Marinimicrobia bacterium]|nr:hypothetical protein [Candidatus Neomarinimicrobiota bacterium]
MDSFYFSIVILIKYQGVNEGGGTNTYCYPTFKEALKHITDEQERYNTLMKSVDVEKYSLENIEGYIKMSDPNLIIVPIFTKRWGHVDNYTFKKTKIGWHIRAGDAFDGPCGPAGYPVLFDALENDMVSYPRNLSAHIEDAWECDELNESRRKLTRIGLWVNACEISSPDGA